MRQAFWYILKLAILVAIAVWLVERPGEVRIQWQGFIVETTVGLLALMVLIVVVIGAILYRIWRSVVSAPGGLRGRMRVRSRERGFQALTRGLVAIAAGDVSAARRHARRADKLLNRTSLSRLLSAQTAQLDGDDEEARRYFASMIESADTEFLGVRGLLVQALKCDDLGEALTLARRARELQPRSTWVLKTLFTLEVRAGNWHRAETSLQEAVSVKAIDPDLGRRHRAALLLERSFAAEHAPDGAKDALSHAKRAHKFAPAFAPAALQLARLLNERGNVRQAMRVVEHTWELQPHPDLAKLWRSLSSDQDPLSLVNWMTRLQRVSPSSAEGHLAVAEVAMEASLWGEARKHLNRAIDEAPSGRAYRLFAELEEAEHQNHEAARQWYEKAADAPAEQAWVCSSCGTIHDVWRGICHACGAFDTLEWKAPTPPAHVSGDDSDAISTPGLVSTTSPAMIPATASSGASDAPGPSGNGQPSPGGVSPTR